MRIGTDFDGTIAESGNARQWYLKKHFNVDLTIGEIAMGGDKKLITDKKEYEKYKNFVNEEGTMLGTIVRNADKVIKKLAGEGHKIIILTGRTGKQAEYAKRFLQRQGIPYNHILYIEGDNPIDKSRRLTSVEGNERKKIIVQKLKLDCLIDDLPAYFVPLSGTGVLLLLINQPWNIGKATPSDVIRINDWEEARTIINMKK